MGFGPEALLALTTLLDALVGSRYLPVIAKEISSVGDLRRKSEVTDEEIEATTAAIARDPEAAQAAEPLIRAIDRALLELAAVKL
ncbi:hypothetical protein ACRBEV_01975 [Methylobacterium phyllosphaerae]